MALLFNRIWGYCKNNKIPLFAQGKRIAIGKIVSEAFQHSKYNRVINKVKKKEPEGLFNVWNYPAEFKDEMDAIISQYHSEFQEPTPEIQPPISAKKRTRIIIRKPLNKQYK